ncbi:unnamed protein product [Meganyctiphanes norvegica]|uniref:Uncharacterized protein n=1 Tax=Meganyctiphanes norvegica TaxID=48144 RepID=A0AAV2S113_MEGNR
MGVINKNYACVSNDKKVKTKHGKVEESARDSATRNINVSWVSHKKCKKVKRKCPIENAQKCRKNSTTHYYDEMNCNCICIIQGEDNCERVVLQNSLALGIIIWLPILAFLLGIAASLAFLYFKARQNKDDGPKNDFINLDIVKSQVIGFSDVEQPIDPPTPPAPIDETSQEKIGFIH